MNYNLVTNQKIVNEIKKVKGFTTNLGFSNYTGKNEQKQLNDKDRFAYFFNTKYNTTIFSNGYLGDINVYIDHYIVNEQIAIYFNKEEFVFDWDFKIMKEKGIEWYLGYFLKSIDEQINGKEIVDNINTEPVKKGDPYKVINNPGQVTFDDIIAYQEAKRKGIL